MLVLYWHTKYFFDRCSHKYATIRRRATPVLCFLSPPKTSGKKYMLRPHLRPALVPRAQSDQAIPSFTGGARPPRELCAAGGIQGNPVEAVEHSRSQPRSAKLRLVPVIKFHKSKDLFVSRRDAKNTPRYLFCGLTSERKFSYFRCFGVLFCSRTGP